MPDTQPPPSDPAAPPAQISGAALQRLYLDYAETKLLLYEAQAQLTTARQELALHQAMAEQPPAVRALRPQKPAGQTKEAAGG